MVGEDTKEEADRFIERIKTGKIKKISPPNMSCPEEYALDRVLESFKSLAESREMKEVTGEYYE